MNPRFMFFAILAVIIVLVLILIPKSSKKILDISLNSKKLSDLKEILNSDTQSQKKSSIKPFQENKSSSSELLILIPKGNTTIKSVQKSLIFTGDVLVNLINGDLKKESFIGERLFKLNSKASLKIKNNKTLVNVLNNELIELKNGSELNINPSIVFPSDFSFPNKKIVVLDKKVREFDISDIFKELELFSISPSLDSWKKLGWINPPPKNSPMWGRINPFGYVTEGSVNVITAQINASIERKEPGFEGIKKVITHQILDMPIKQRASDPEAPCNGYFMEAKLEEGVDPKAIFLSFHGLKNNNTLSKFDTVEQKGTIIQYYSGVFPHSALDVDQNSEFIENDNNKSSIPNIVDQDVLKIVGVNSNKKDLGSGVTIAILDTGFFSGNNSGNQFFQKGKDSARNLTAPFLDSIIRFSEDGKNDLDDLTTYPDLKITSDEYLDHKTNRITGHGTALAALAAAVAPGARILPLKVCDSHGICDETDVIRGICYALQNSKQNNQKLVINLSLGSKNLPPQIKDFLEYAMQQGALISVSAGKRDYDAGNNVFDDTPRYPAALASPSKMETPLKGMLVVAALTKDEKPFDNSPRGDYVDLAAPGVDVQSIDPSGSSQTYTGTSFASPLAAGVLAACRSQMLSDEGLSASDLQKKLLGIIEQIKQGVTKFDSSKGDFSGFGTGILNLKACIK